MRVLRLFTAHPAAMGESYVTHAGRALRIAGLLLAGAVAAAVHAVVPALFVTTASDIARAVARGVDDRAAAGK
jgi:hypothetical protein